MNRDGFDDTSPGGLFGGPVSHPFSSEEIPLWSIFINYTLNKKVGFSFLISRGPTGETIGYKREPESFIELAYDSKVIAPIVSYRPFSAVWLGLGPILFFNKIELHSAEKIISKEIEKQLGAVLDGYWVFPPTPARFFVRLEFQYRWTPRSTFGPFTEPINSARLNPFEVNFSSAFIGGGVGIRF
jgi:hypothetical protein